MRAAARHVFVPEVQKHGSAPIKIVIAAAGGAYGASNGTTKRRLREEVLRSTIFPFSSLIHVTRARFIVALLRGAHRLTTTHTHKTFFSFLLAIHINSLIHKHPLYGILSPFLKT